MQVIIGGKNVRVSKALKTYVEKKIGKLDHYLPSLMEARVEFASERIKNAEQRQVIQVTLRGNRAVLRAEERSSDLTAAVDAVLEKLYKQIDRYKGKHYHRRGKEERLPIAAAEKMEGAGPPIVRRKKFQTPPLTEEEAIEQMESLGHSFFVFFNRASGALNVLYRRNDGNYGLIEPEMTKG